MKIIFYTHTVIVIVYFQRQGLVQYKIVPNFGKVCQLGMFWLFPFLAYLISMYCVAFNKASLVISIFVMGVMLHPFIAIPLAVCSKRISKITYDFFIKKIKNKNNSSTCGLSSISIIVYLGFIVLNQIYLYTNWINFREEQINQNCPKTNLSDAECANSFKTANSYGSYLFYQCHCQNLLEYEEDACVKTGNTTDAFLEEKFSTIRPENIPYILFGYIILLMIVQSIQTFIPSLRFPPSIPMHDFLLVKTHKKEFEDGLDNNGSKDCNDIVVEFNSTEQIIQTTEKINMTEKQTIQGKQKIKQSLFSVDTISVIIAITFLISLYRSVYIFYPSLYEWKVSCNLGFYDTHSDSNILKCTGR